MTSFGAVLKDMKPNGDDSWSAAPTDDWRQGRTLFGGLSAALCYAACERLVPNLPPLRSAQIAFVGPSAGEATLRPTVLRQGKSVTFMACDLIAEGGVATRALFCFGGDRESAFRDSAPSAPPVAAARDCPPLFGDVRPTFTQHLDQRIASMDRPVQGASKGDLIVWVRHLSDDLPPSLAPFVALGDALPPASMPRLTGPAAISTMTWHFDLFDPSQIDPSGWFLIRSTDDGVGSGYAGQAMAMWDEQGRSVLIGRQSVAIFA